uniref:Uncharacterized protein n=1 Tax=Arundo donax TaxID=35708 RepID=A0A0A8ZJC1_ARUDO
MVRALSLSFRRKFCRKLCILRAYMSAQAHVSRWVLNWSFEKLVELIQ